MVDDKNNLYGGRLNTEINRITALFHKAEELANLADAELNEDLTPDGKSRAVKALKDASAARLEAQLAWARLKQDMDAGARLKPKN